MVWQKLLCNGYPDCAFLHNESRSSFLYIIRLAILSISAAIRAYFCQIYTIYFNVFCTLFSKFFFGNVAFFRHICFLNPFRSSLCLNFLFFFAKFLIAYCFSPAPLIYLKYELYSFFSLHSVSTAP